MELKVVTGNEYDESCKEYQYFYNSRAFHELNRDKVDYVEYIVFTEKKKKFALAIGVKDSILKVPYSSPFGIFEKLQPHIKIEDIEGGLALLEEYAQNKKISSILFKIPPAFYDESFVSKFSNCISRKDYRVVACDLNYHLLIKDMHAYQTSLQRNARKNLNVAMRQNFVFQHCNTEAERCAAYDVIAINRKRKGYSLRMSCEQVEDTIALTDSDFFLLKEEETNIAAAIVFKVNREVYQVIYWGDVEGYEAKRPMNYLAYKLYEYYLKKGICVLDIGPSTEGGIPNYGLCDYKESIGCEVSMKYTYMKNISEKGHKNERY